jgi:hypothetical protein
MDGTLSVSDAVKVAAQPPKVQNAAVEAVRAGTAKTAREAAGIQSSAVLSGLPPEGRFAVETGWTTESAARHVLHLNIYDRIATRPPFEGESGHRTWADLSAKKILWRPRFARTEEQIAYGVDSDLFDLWEVKHLYGDRPKAEANRLAEENLRDRGRDEKGCFSPEYWWAFLWVRMRPDYSRLSRADHKMLDEATCRYLFSDLLR